MSIEYVRKHRQTLASDVLQRELFLDDLPELDDGSLDRLIAETEVTVKCLNEDHDMLGADDPGRVHVRHKRNVWKTYRQAAMIEKRMRGVDANERFYELVAERIGKGATEELMALARG
jgi:hypothetical protein